MISACLYSGKPSFLFFSSEKMYPQCNVLETHKNAQIAYDKYGTSQFAVRVIHDDERKFKITVPWEVIGDRQQIRQNVQTVKFHLDYFIPSTDWMVPNTLNTRYIDFTQILFFGGQPERRMNRSDRFREFSHTVRIGQVQTRYEFQTISTVFGLDVGNIKFTICREHRSPSSLRIVISVNESPHGSSLHHFLSFFTGRTQLSEAK